MRLTAFLASLFILVGLTISPQHASAQPSRDSDGDGIPDANDRCPNAPEDRDGFQDQDGCPDPDNDQDGIPDVRDLCPNQPETVNGYKDQDGCPDTPPRPARKAVSIPQTIYFRRGSSDIGLSARQLVQQVAVMLLRRRGIQRLEIQGHADDPGSPAKNRKLSLARAKAVRLMMIKRGVAARRLAIRAHGRTRLARRGRRAADRAWNRRVTFKVLP